MISLLFFSKPFTLLCEGANVDIHLYSAVETTLSKSTAFPDNTSGSEEHNDHHRNITKLPWIIGVGCAVKLGLFIYSCWYMCFVDID